MLTKCKVLYGLAKFTLTDIVNTVNSLAKISQTQKIDPTKFIDLLAADYIQSQHDAQRQLPPSEGEVN
jgi:hypothetical protein